jgi:hypothetical protein
MVVSNDVQGERGYQLTAEDFDAYIGSLDDVDISAQEPVEKLEAGAAMQKLHEHFMQLEIIAVSSPFCHTHATAKLAIS